MPVKENEDDKLRLLRIVTFSLVDFSKNHEKFCMVNCFVISLTFETLITGHWVFYIMAEMVRRFTGCPDIPFHLVSTFPYFASIHSIPMDLFFLETPVQMNMSCNLAKF